MNNNSDMTVLDFDDNNPASPKVVVIMPEDNVLDLSIIDTQLNMQYLYVMFNRNGFIVNGLQPLIHFQHLKELILLDVANLHTQMALPLATLTSLVSLELGRCDAIWSDLVNIVLPELKKLQLLRLECNRNNFCSGYDILDIVTEHLHDLINLQLVNCTIVNGFEFKLGQCVNLQTLLIVPIYDGMIYTTLQRVYNALRRAAPALQTVTWVVTIDAVQTMNTHMIEPTDEILESIWLYCLGVSQHDELHENLADGCYCWERLGLQLASVLLHMYVKLVQLPFAQTFTARV